ncbi:MAG: transposase [bacterium]
MARFARAVVPGVPHHITQRGNRRQNVFFRDADYEAYLRLMEEWCRKCGVEVWAYCLMPNHVHLVAVPEQEDSLARALGEAHRRYTVSVNKREYWTGYLWQGRFASFPMDEEYLQASVRYIELNPVRAGLVKQARHWPWSSARAHLAGRNDELVRVKPMLGRVPDWREFLVEEVQESDAILIRLHTRTGRPLGERSFVAAAERKLHRVLAPQKRGPKPRAAKRAARRRSDKTD